QSGKTICDHLVTCQDGPSVTLVTERGPAGWLRRGRGEGTYAANEAEAAGQHHRAVRRGEVPPERCGHRSVWARHRDERERACCAVPVVQHERAMAVVAPHLVVRDRASDEACDEAVELL